MKALKILTAVMGVMILIGFSIIVVELIHRIQAPEPEPTAGTARDGAPFTSSVNAPDDSQLADVQAADDHLVLTFDMPDGTTLIKLVDPLDGRELGTITVPTDFRPAAEGTGPLWER